MSLEQSQTTTESWTLRQRHPWAQAQQRQAGGQKARTLRSLRAWGQEAWPRSEEVPRAALKVAIRFQRWGRPACSLEASLREVRRLQRETRALVGLQAGHQGDLHREGK